MFVVFEGIDGSGKTTVSNLVVEKLRARGIRIEHVREGGIFASSLVNRIREFAKDSRNLSMAPLTELLLYVARDAQLLTECVRPALARGSLVFADRYLYSYEVLGHHGRGLPADQVRTIIDAVAEGLWPDLVVLMDVDPHVARARRKVSKLVARGLGNQTVRAAGSRKGLQGIGTQHRLREGYLALARQDPERWMVVDNSSAAQPDSSLDELVNDLSEVVARLWQRRSRSSIPVVRARSPLADEEPLLLADFDAGRDAFYRAVHARAAREVPVAAYFLAGLNDERAYDLRDAWAARAPDAVAYGLRGLDDERAWALRERLADLAPYHVVRSVAGLEGERVSQLRERFVATQPAAVLATLNGSDSPAAWALRERLCETHLGRVVASLARLPGDSAWALRERYHDLVRDAGDASAISCLVDSVRGLGDARAWALRERYLEILPVAVLGSLAGLDDDRSWALRERFVGQAAKIVMRTFDGSRDLRAWRLRAELAPRVKEALGSMVGLDDDEAWGIREACRDIWPSTTIKSLGALGCAGRGRTMAMEALSRHPSNISLLKHIARLAAMARSLHTNGSQRAS